MLVPVYFKDFSTSYNMTKTNLGKYKIISELGQGAFATVHLAQDTVLHRKVALKILPPPLLVNPNFVRRFL